MVLIVFQFQATEGPTQVVALAIRVSDTDDMVAALLRAQDFVREHITTVPCASVEVTTVGDEVV